MGSLEAARNWKMEIRNSPATQSIKLKGAIKDFTDLEVWKAARTVRKEAYDLARRLPDFEKFGLASQLRRAATSVTANLTEGFGRFGCQENAQLCGQARGSL